MVLSPGHTCPSWYHVGLATRLATHGYVTAVLDHYGEGDSPVTISLQEVMFHRPRDVSFVITDLLARSDAPGDPLHGAIDASRIAAGGHSIAGYAGLALAAGDDSVCDSAFAIELDGRVVQSTCVPTPTDDRIRALVSLDGSSQLLRYGELARVQIPSLLMGQTVATAGTFVARPHAAIQRADSYRVDVERSVHNSFNHLCDGLGIAVAHGYITATYAEYLRTKFGCYGALPPAEVHQVMTRYVVAFLSVHLLGIASDAVTLTEADAAIRTPAVQFFESETCSATLPDEAHFSYRTLQTGGVCAVAEKDPVEYFAPP